MEYNREARKRPYNYNQLISDKGNSMEKEQFFFQKLALEQQVSIFK